MATIASGSSREVQSRNKVRALKGFNLKLISCDDVAVCDRSRIVVHLGVAWKVLWHFSLDWLKFGWQVAGVKRVWSVWR